MQYNAKEGLSLYYQREPTVILVRKLKKRCLVPFAMNAQNVSMNQVMKSYLNEIKKSQNCVFQSIYCTLGYTSFRYLVMGHYHIN